MTSAPEDFHVAVEREGATITVSLRGELDIATLPALREAVTAPAEAGRVVMDLRRLAFLDSMSIEFLLTLHEDMAAAGGELVVVRGPRAVDRLFRVMELDRVLSIVDEPPGRQLTRS